MLLCADRAASASSGAPGAAATLTPAHLRRTLDELWRGAPLRLSPWEQARAEAARILAGALPHPEPAWAVAADGWRLVVYDGAIAGIEQESS